MPKRATAIQLSEQEQEELTRLTKRHRSEQQEVLRARIIVAAAQGASTIQIARDLGINVDTVRLWRDRWASWQEADHEKSGEGKSSLAQRLQDAPRPGAVPKFTIEQRAQMAALACEAPGSVGRPISQWTGREIADELKARGIVTQISPRHAARLLKKGASNRTGFAIGSRRSQMSNGKRKLWRAVRSMPKPQSERSEANERSAWMS
jgi:putative transposase